VAEYFTDFSEYTTGVAPGDWTNQFATGTTRTVESDGGATGGKLLRMVSTSSARQAFSWDDIDSDADRDDAEIVFRWRVTSDPAGGSGLLRGIVRGGGSTSTEQGYVGGCLSVSTHREGKYVAGSFTNLGDDSFAVSLNTWYWTRHRVNGTTLQTRTWADSGSEPGTWNIHNATDGSISGTGFVGFFNNTGDSATVEIDVFGVGTNGDTAPSAAAGGFKSAWAIGSNVILGAGASN